MKKIYTLIVFIVTLTISAQAPQGFNYQATVRNNSGALIINKSVSFKFNIIPTSATARPVYSEIQTITTDDVGQVSLVIGRGTATTGTFATIDWGTGTYFLGIELNTGNGFIAMGTTQLLSVPYALYAKSSGSAMAPGTANGQILYWNGTAWVTLAPGANGTNLKLNNGLPVWENSVGSIASGTATGQLLYWNGTAWVTLAPGTDGDVLRVSNGIPTFSKTIPKLMIKDHLYSFESDNTIKLNVQSVLIDTGGDLISKKGIVLSTTNNLPTIADDYLNYNTFANLFYVRGDYEAYDDVNFYEIENLQPNTTYYIRTYAENEIGMAYSNLFTFITPSTQPFTISLSKPTITTIKGSSTNVQSTIQSVNNAVPKTFDSGYVISKTPNPNINSSIKITNSLNSIFTINDLEPNSTYYIKSYVTHLNGTSYSEQSIFTTLAPSTPSFSNFNISSITQTVTGVNCTIDSDGGSTITQKGIVWSTSPNPTIALTTKSIYFPLGSFTPEQVIYTNATELFPATTYYIRAFATNAIGTSYSKEIAFTTLPLSTPSSMQVFNPSTITATNANISVSIGSNGGSTITQKGLVWSTSTNPTIALTTKNFDTSVNNSFFSSITGLSPSTTYYVRAFATNAIGTSYSKEIAFTTSAPSIPVFTNFAAPSFLTPNSISVGSSIQSNGGATISEQGFVWGTTSNPTTSNSKIIGSTATISGLLSNTTYYVRAYAINAAGTGYSNERSFTTP
jgi:hypothetical protein